MLNRVKQLVDRITFNVLNTIFHIIVSLDKINPESGRVYIQIIYTAPCSKTGEHLSWSSRKWYLSEFMTDDEIVKTTYAACKAAIEHEVMEGFKVDNTIVFNPHVDYTQLMTISHLETKR